MTNPHQAPGLSRCQRCGYDFQPQDNFCAQCGAFLRDPWVDHRLLLALTLERDVRELSRLRQGHMLRALLDRLAGQTGQVLNV